jgi:hypothetical protein
MLYKSQAVVKSSAKLSHASMSATMDATKFSSPLSEINANLSRTKKMSVVVPKIRLLSADTAAGMKRTGRIPDNFKVTSIPTSDESVVHAMIPIGFSLVAAKVRSSKQDSIILVPSGLVLVSRSERLAMSKKQANSPAKAKAASKKTKRPRSLGQASGNNKKVRPNGTTPVKEASTMTTPVKEASTIHSDGLSGSPEHHNRSASAMKTLKVFESSSDKVDISYDSDLSEIIAETQDF